LSQSRIINDSKCESFMENFPADKITNKTLPEMQLSDIKNLRERFNSMFENLKKTMQTQDEFFTRQTETEENKSISLMSSKNDACTISNSMLNEEEPQLCLQKPIEKVISMKDTFNNSDGNCDQLQTSILNINDEIKQNDIHKNLFSDSKMNTLTKIRVFRIK
jgi:hypothetical protein